MGGVLAPSFERTKIRVGGVLAPSFERSKINVVVTFLTWSPLLTAVIDAAFDFGAVSFLRPLQQQKYTTRIAMAARITVSVLPAEGTVMQNKESEQINAETVCTFLSIKVPRVSRIFMKLTN